MIIPNYQQASWPLIHATPSLNKWYCSYFEEKDNIQIPRYLSPTGWQRPCFWWNTKKEAELAFKNHGQSPLPIEDFEIQNAIKNKKEFEKQKNKV